MNKHQRKAATSTTGKTKKPWSMNYSTAFATKGKHAFKNVVATTTTGTIYIHIYTITYT